MQKKQKKPKSKPPTIRKLRKRPLRDAAELERLSIWVAERQAKHRERGRMLLVAAAIIAMINVLVQLTQPGGPSSDFFIFPAMLVLAAAIVTVTIARWWWSYPRLLAAQRRLLRDRHPGSPDLEDPENLLVELEARISEADVLLNRERHSRPEP